MQLCTTEEIIDYLDRQINFWEDQYELYRNTSSEGCNLCTNSVAILQNVRKFICEDKFSNIYDQNRLIQRK